MTLGFVLIFLGIQFALVDSYQLTPRVANFLSEQTNAPTRLTPKLAISFLRKLLRWFRVLLLGNGPSLRRVGFAGRCYFVERLYCCMDWENRVIEQEHPLLFTKRCRIQNFRESF